MWGQVGRDEIWSVVRGQVTGNTGYYIKDFAFELKIKKVSEQESDTIHSEI